MKQASIVVLQVVLIGISIVSLIFILWEPHLEGRNAQASVYDIYFKDPFLAYVYLASVWYFLGLYHVFKLLDLLRRGNINSLAALKSLRAVRLCAIVLICFVSGAEIYFSTVQRSKGEDIAGGVFMGILLICLSILVLVAVRRFEKKVRKNSALSNAIKPGV
jgi:hypothetical protein